MQRIPIPVTALITYHLEYWEHRKDGPGLAESQGCFQRKRHALRESAQWGTRSAAERRHGLMARDVTLDNVSAKTARNAYGPPAPARAG